MYRLYTDAISIETAGEVLLINFQSSFFSSTEDCQYSRYSRERPGRNRECNLQGYWQPQSLGQMGHENGGRASRTCHTIRL